MYHLQFDNSASASLQRSSKLDLHVNMLIVKSFTFIVICIH